MINVNVSLFIVILFSSFISIFGMFLSPLLGPVSGGIRFFSVILFWIAWGGIICRDKFNLDRVAAYYFILSIIFVFFSVGVNLNSQYGMLGIINGFSSYIGYVPVAFVFIHLAKNDCLLFKKAMTFIYYSSIVLLFGVLLDGLFYINDFIGLGSLNRIDASSVRRANFVLSTPTAVYFPIAYILAFQFYNYRINYKDLVVVSICICSAFLTYSRLPLMLSAISFSLYLFFHSKRSFSYNSYVFLFFIILFFAINIVPKIQDSDFIYKLQLVFDNSDDGNEGRFYLWNKGLRLFFDMANYVGSGIGSSNLNFSKTVGTAYISNYESSALSSFGELGIVGLLSFFSASLLPFIYAKNIFEYSISLFMLINICIAPLYAGYQTPFYIVCIASLFFFGNHQEDDSLLS